MKNITKIIVPVVFGLLAISLFIVAPVKAQAAVNLDSFSNEGLPILSGKNNTDSPDSIDYRKTINADSGEIIKLQFHYHNFSPGELANGVQMRVSIPSHESSNFTVSGSLFANNSAAVYTDSVNINLSSSQRLEFVSGSVVWFPRFANATPLPNGQSGDTITSIGINVGDAEFGNSNSGFVYLRLRVIGNNQQPQGAAPSVTTLSMQDVADDSATLRGSVNPNGSQTQAWFEWSTDFNSVQNGNGTRTFEQSVGSGNFSSDISTRVFNLSRNSTIFFRASARNNFGTTNGQVISFVTGFNNNGCAPIVSTNSASFISETSATLRASVTPNGRSTTGWFEYGQNFSLGLRTSSQDLGSNSFPTDMLRFVSNLNPNSTVFFRAVAENSCGMTQGSVLSFTTQGQGFGGLPLVNTLSASGVGQTSASLNGEVNPRGSDTTSWFEYGTDSSLSNFLTTSTFSAGSGNSFRSTTSFVSGLSRGTTHYFRAAARNNSGTAKGSIVSFRTSSVVAPAPSPVPTSVDLSLTKEVRNITAPNGTPTNNEAFANDMLEYTLTIRNTESVTVRDITVTDMISPELEIIEASRVFQLTNLGSLTWKLDPLTPGNSEIISVRAKVRETAKNAIARNSFSVSSSRINKISNETLTEVIVPIVTDGAAGVGFSFSGSWWVYLLWFLLVLLILAIAYLYFRLSKLIKSNY